MKKTFLCLCLMISACHSYTDETTSGVETSRLPEDENPKPCAESIQVATIEGGTDSSCQGPCSYIQVKVNVPPLAAGKQVGLRYQFNAVEPWQEALALEGSQRRLTETCEQWTVLVKGAHSMQMRFAAFVGEAAGGIRYWDNNDKQDYFVVIEAGELNRDKSRLQ